MAFEASPENVEWLAGLVARSPLLPDPVLRRHWQRLLPWLSSQDRYALAGVLLEVEHACATT